MSVLSVKVIEFLRRVFIKLFGKKLQYECNYERFVGQSASDLIKMRLLDDKPLMISRFGSTELNTMTRYHFHKMNLFLRVIYFIIGKIDHFEMDNQVYISISELSGFFPANIRTIEQFHNVMLADIEQIDILGSWLLQETVFKKYMKNIKRINLSDIEPYYHSEPWTIALQGKTVLVVHPFDKSIREQYKKRDLLFENPLILPEFNLKTIKAVQTIAGSTSEFATWFDALDFMKQEISKTEFDIAIIGCGAYGLPLAAHVKRMGKKAIHMGGATQLLFGIKGKRWEDHKVISGLFNQHWISPAEEEKPKGFSKVENGCYW